MVTVLQTLLQRPRPLAEIDRTSLARFLTDLIRQQVYPTSLEPTSEGVFFLARDGREKRLGILSEAGLHDFEGVRHQLSLDGRTLIFQSCPLTAANARALRRHIPWTAPVPLGLRA
uniref:tagaturonate epimerase family protein n=1 Tax=Rhodothermus marinus TaxID=29549 RepID=UPI000A5C354F